MDMIIAMRHLILEIVALFFAGIIIGGAAARSVLDRRAPRRRWDSSGIFTTDRYIRRPRGGGP